ncbi:uncharacterized protein LOC127790718 isoform X2 [Diospyros lotus]|uniref:uncharacterized protein LOC127790718 isoform X2 n=1 Tax=Diospyros lotus TaxID=55363 RepID=UPI00224CCF74|nr:uncharacterized protein LOC127790718 isoform X2 [Diospyros lotus]
MDDAERLTALKKAYAEMILNTSKEAAARIMASERKVLRLQHELNVTKEAALQMMLRLKEMMEFKVSEARITYLRQQEKIDKLTAQLQEKEDVISEAETVSLGQQRKIEELEAQLQEAEDIVSNLREELREEQAVVERERNGKLQHMDEHHVASEEQTSNEKRSDTSQSIPSLPPMQLESFSNLDMKNSSLNQISEVYKSCNEKDYCIGNSCIGQLNMSSTSVENKLKTFQSIIFPPQEPCPESCKASDMKNSASSQRNDAYKCYSEKYFVTGNSYVSQPNLPSEVHKSKEPEPYRNRRTQRIRAFEEKLNAGELSFSDDVNYEMSARKDGGGERIRKARTRTTEKKAGVQADGNCNEVKEIKPRRWRRRKRKTASKTKKNQTSHVSSTGADSVKENAQYDADPSKIVPALSADTDDNGAPSHLRNVTESNADFVKAGVQADGNYDEVKEVKPPRWRRRKRKTALKTKRNQTSHVSSTGADSVKENAQYDADPSKIVPALSADTDNNGAPSHLRNVTEGNADFVKAGVQADGNYDEVKEVKPIRWRRRKRKTALKTKRNQTSHVSSTGADSVKENAQYDADPSKIVPALSADTDDNGAPSHLRNVTESIADFVKAVSAENTMNKYKEKTSGTSTRLLNYPSADRVFKYTFQRKRKREALSSSDGNTSVENSILNKKAAEKQNHPMETEKSSSTIESSRDKRRLAQVARQLLSLSDRFWQ